MKSFICRLITPLGMLYEGETHLVIAPGIEGEFGVLANHEHMLSILKFGVVTIERDQQKRYFAIDSGVLEIDGDHAVIVLADRAVEGTSIEDAKEKFNQLDPKKIKV